MSEPSRGYPYVGPADLLAAVAGASRGTAVRTAAGFTEWVSARTPEELAEPFTFVVGVDGVLRLAPRRSEHVACAGGQRVLSAGEIGFRWEARRWVVVEVSNQSTGYCPDVSSWAAVSAALERIGIPFPPGFTYAAVFRRCGTCRELNIVREEDFVCVFCGEDLPPQWNVDEQDL